MLLSRSTSLYNYFTLIILPFPSICTVCLRSRRADINKYTKWSAESSRATWKCFPRSIPRDFTIPPRLFVAVRYRSRPRPKLRSVVADLRAKFYTSLAPCKPAKRPRWKIITDRITRCHASRRTWSTRIFINTGDVVVFPVASAFFFFTGTIRCEHGLTLVYNRNGGRVCFISSTWKCLGGMIVVGLNV